MFQLFKKCLQGTRFSTAVQSNLFTTTYSVLRYKAPPTPL